MSAMEMAGAPAAAAPDLAKGVAYVEGSYVPIAEAKLSLLDWGFVRSDVTYDVVHVWKGSFFRLDDHLDRFERSVAGLRMTLPHGRDEVRGILMECVRRSGLRDAYVWMACTRGLVPPGMPRHPRFAENRFMAFAMPYVSVASPEQMARGLHATISSVPRIPPESVDPTIKNFHWGDMTRALWEAYERGAEQPILLDGEGNVTEGPGFNVFAVIGEAVVTPPRGALEGITRRTVLELCAELGVAAEARPLAAEELREADEVFISSTAGGVMPVTRLDGRIYGNDRPGPLTMRIHDLYWAKHDEGWHATPVDYG